MKTIGRNLHQDGLRSKWEIFKFCVTKNYFGLLPGHKTKHGLRYEPQAEIKFCWKATTNRVVR